MNRLVNRLNMSRFVAVLSLAVLVSAFGCGSQNNSTPLIFAAASLADVLTESAQAYEAESGNAVEFNFGGSTALANQIARLNAPADGVILAGTAPVQLLVDRGLLAEADVRVIARNSLVVVSSDRQSLQSLSDLAKGDARVAIADPELAPAGQYAKEALVSAGAWDDLSGRLIPTQDVRAALAAASSGSVDFAIVYATDAMTKPGLNVVLTIEPSLHQPVVYPAAAFPGSSMTGETSAFLDFLLGPEGQRILLSRGFSVN